MTRLTSREDKTSHINIMVMAEIYDILQEILPIDIPEQQRCH